MMNNDSTLPRESCDLFNWLTKSHGSRGRALSLFIMKIYILHLKIMYFHPSGVYIFRIISEYIKRHEYEV